MGFLQEARGRIASVRESARALPAIRAARSDPSLARVLETCRAGTALGSLGQPLGLPASMRRRDPPWREPQQRPRDLYMPGLNSAPFLGPDPITRLLEASMPAIRAEYAAFTGDETLTPSAALVSAGLWMTVPLRRGSGVVRANVERLPKLWALLRQLPLMPARHGGAYFSVLNPGTRIDPHCGPTNLRVRYHLTIVPEPRARIRCGSEWRSWEEGQCHVLDDSFEHEVIHDGDSKRVVLIVDCWHPDLTVAERRFLDTLYSCWYPARKAGWDSRYELAPDVAPLAT